MKLTGVLRKAALCLFAMLLLLGAMCPDPAATIKFRQVGACNGYMTDTGLPGSTQHMTNAGGGGAWVVFEVLSIDNSPVSTDFHFDPQRLYISGTSPAEHVDMGLPLAKDLAIIQQRSVPLTVPARTFQGNNGFAVVRVSTATINGAIEANKSNYMLAYDRGPSDPPVVLDKTNLSQTSWPQTENCREIHFRPSGVLGRGRTVCAPESR